jgi:hypothetical protein
VCVWGGAFYLPHPTSIPMCRKASKFKQTSAGTDNCDNYGSREDRRNGLVFRFVGWNLVHVGGSLGVGRFLVDRCVSGTWRGRPLNEQ